MRRIVGLIALGLMAVGCDSPSPSRPLAPVAPVEASATPAGVADGIPGDGDYIVGVDIAPGTYRSAGPSGRLPSCYHTRWADVQKDDSIKTDLSKGPTILVVQAGDALIETRGCEPFAKIG